MNRLEKAAIVAGFVFVNFNVRGRKQGFPFQQPRYRPDCVVYCKLDDGRVRRVYMFAEKYLPENSWDPKSGKFFTVDGYAVDVEQTVALAYSKAVNQVCGFETLKPSDAPSK